MAERGLRRLDKLISRFTSLEQTAVTKTGKRRAGNRVKRYSGIKRKIKSQEKAAEVRKRNK